MTQQVISTKIQYAPHATNISTEGTPYTELSRVQSCDMWAENSLILDRGLGEGFNVGHTYYGPYNCGGSIIVHPVDFDFLKHWIGAKSGAGTSGDKYIITEATSTGYAGTAGILQYFSLERLNDSEAADSVDVMIGCIGTSFSLSGSVGSKLEFTGNFVGYKDLHRATHTAYVPITDTSFIMLGGTWKWGATPTALAGVKSFKIDYDNGLVTGDETRSMESRFVGESKLAMRTYKFTCDILMSSGLASTIYADFYGQVATSGPVDGSSALQPTASLEFNVALINSNKYATFQLDETVINRISKPTRLGSGLVVLTFEGYARKGLTNVPITWWTT